MEKFPSSEMHEEDYRRQQAERVLAGEMVWVERDEDELGCRVDLYYERKWQGFIHQEYGYGSTAYFNDEEGLIRVYESPAIEDAREYVERYMLLKGVMDNG